MASAMYLTGCVDDEWILTLGGPAAQIRATFGSVSVGLRGEGLGSPRLATRE
jgi:hypothetical protein